jgi:hypothetical protein
VLTPDSALGALREGGLHRSVPRLATPHRLAMWTEMGGSLGIA